MKDYPRQSLFALYIRHHLDCGNIIYDQCNNRRFQERLGSIQDTSVVAIVQLISGSPKHLVNLLL